MGFILVAFVVILTKTADSKYHHRSQPTFQQKGEWTIYTADNFEENELCQVLSCNKQRDVCMARNNNAMCVQKEKVDQVEGEKTYFQKKSHQKTNSKNRQYHEEKLHNPVDKEAAKDKAWKDHYSKKINRYQEKVDKIQPKFVKHPNDYHKPSSKDSQMDAKIEKTNSISERHSEEGSGPKFDCNDQQLKEMGARLLQWFSDVHATEQGANSPLPKHHISCRQDVGWMFQQLDGDQNGHLTVHELYSLEQDRYEPCIKPFLDRCDIGADDTISLDEWCDCFQWSDHVKEEPPCHKAQRNSDPHLLGAFVPRCDVDGFYRPEQCHEGHCWCVDRLGREFDHSRTRGRHADCGQYADSTDDEDIHPPGGSGDKEDAEL